jgi:hypothetical protein
VKNQSDWQDAKNWIDAEVNHGDWPIRSTTWQALMIGILNRPSLLMDLASFFHVEEKDLPVLCYAVFEWQHMRPTADGSWIVDDAIQREGDALARRAVTRHQARTAPEPVVPQRDSSRPDFNDEETV